LAELKRPMVAAPVWGRVVTTSAVVGGLLLVYALAPFERPWGAAVGIAVAVGSVPGLVHFLRRVLASPHPFVDAVAAVTITFALLVLGSSAAYYAMGAADPAAFDGLETKVDAVYFTVVLTSTIGFGDIVPLSQAARLLTTIHIAFSVVMAGGSVRLLARAARSRRFEPPT
jgi:voltage-gated potassium channel